MLASENFHFIRRFGPALETAAVNDPLRAPWTEADDEEAVILFQNLAESPAQVSQSGASQVHPKDGELQMLAATFQNLIDLCPALRIAAIITDQMSVFLFAHARPFCS